jgi:hypothetical protein
MLYPGMENSGRRHLFRVGRVDFVSQGGDYVDRVDGIDAGHDPVGRAKADGIPAAAVSGGDGDQVLPGQSASGRTRLWLGTGIRCRENYSTRGRRKSEEKSPELVQEIHALVESKAQADPKFQTPLAYTRITAKAVRERLLANAAGDGRHVPAERTVHDILNRLGYRLRRVQKTKPQKKSPRPTPSSTTCEKSTPRPTKPRKRSASRSTPRPR